MDDITESYDIFILPKLESVESLISENTAITFLLDR